MALKGVLDQRFNASQHMDLCMAKDGNCKMSVDYVFKPQIIDDIRMKYSEIKLPLICCR